MPNTRRLSDATLVRRSQQGDRRAFTALLNRYDWRLRGLAHALLLDRAEMDTALGIGYLRAWRDVVRINAKDDVGAWLYRVTYNACIDQLRRADSAGAAPEPGAAHPSGGVAAGLATLPAAERVVVVLVDREGFSPASAARILGLTPTALTASLDTARERLAAYLPPSEPHESDATGARAVADASDAEPDAGDRLVPADAAAAAGPDGAAGSSDDVPDAAHAGAPPTDEPEEPAGPGAATAAGSQGNGSTPGRSPSAASGARVDGVHANGHDPTDAAGLDDTTPEPSAAPTGDDATSESQGPEATAAGATVGDDTKATGGDETSGDAGTAEAGQPNGTSSIGGQNTKDNGDNGHAGNSGRGRRARRRAKHAASGQSADRPDPAGDDTP